MRWLALTAIFAVIVAVCSTDGAFTGNDTELASGPIGLWVVPDAQVREVNEQAADRDRVIFLAPAPFYFDGESAVLELWAPKAWMWRSADGYYRVKTKWVDGTLYYLPPFAGWQRFTTFRNDHFERQESGIIWKYERVAPNRIPPELQSYVIHRDMHDYAITAIGTRDPERLKDLD